MIINEVEISEDIITNLKIASDFTTYFDLIESMKSSKSTIKED